MAPSKLQARYLSGTFQSAALPKYSPNGPPLFELECWEEVLWSPKASYPPYMTVPAALQVYSESCGDLKVSSTQQPGSIRVCSTVNLGSSDPPRHPGVLQVLLRQGHLTLRLSAGAETSCTEAAQKKTEPSLQASEAQEQRHLRVSESTLWSLLSCVLLSHSLSSHFATSQLQE